MGNGFKTKVCSEEARDDGQEPEHYRWELFYGDFSLVQRELWKQLIYHPKYPRVDPGKDSQAELQESRFQSPRR